MQPPAQPGAASKLVLSVTRAGKVTVTVPGAGKVTVTAKRKYKQVAKVSKTAKAAGKVTFKLKLRGKVTVTAKQAEVDREADAHNACMTLDSTVALVTGASSGSARRRRAPGGPGREGRDRRPRKDRLDALGARDRALAIEADITDREQAIAAVGQTVTTGRLDRWSTTRA